MSDTLRTYTDATGGLLDFHSNALSELLSPKVMDLEYHPSEGVCDRCHLTYWKPLGHCPNC